MQKPALPAILRRRALCSSAGSPCCSSAGPSVKGGGNSFLVLNVDRPTSPPKPHYNRGN